MSVSAVQSFLAEALSYLPTQNVIDAFFNVYSISARKRSEIPYIMTKIIPVHASGSQLYISLPTVWTFGSLVHTPGLFVKSQYDPRANAGCLHLPCPGPQFPFSDIFKQSKWLDLMCNYNEISVQHAV